MSLACNPAPDNSPCVPFSDITRAISCPGGVFSSPAAMLFMDAVGGVLRAV
jgi:hypothetical protein